MIRVIVVLLVWIGSASTVAADVIMTLEATGGSLRHRQDSAVGSTGVSGAGFFLGGFGPLSGSALPLTLSHSAIFGEPGQLIDQSGPLFLDAPLVGINGQPCCGMSGVLNIAAIPAVGVLGGGVSGPPTLVVTAPFTASGILTTNDFLTSGQGPFGEYFFQGTGTMTSEFWRSCITPNAPCYFWNSSVLTFGSSTSTVPEPFTWLLLASGLVVLFLSRRRLMSQLNQPHGYSR